MCLTAPPESCKYLAPNAAKIANSSSIKTVHLIIGIYQVIIQPIV